MQIPTKNHNNKSGGPNFERSSQESSNANSLMINTKNATKGKSDESSKIKKIKQIRSDRTSNVKDEETYNDNIPLFKLYKHRHTTITNH